MSKQYGVNKETRAACVAIAKSNKSTAAERTLAAAVVELSGHVRELGHANEQLLNELRSCRLDMSKLMSARARAPKKSRN